MDKLIKNIFLTLLILSTNPIYSYRASDLKKLKATGSCVKCDLGGANLDRLDLHGANLAYTNLINASLVGTNLQNVDFTNAILVNANLAHADTRGMIRDGANFTGVNFNNTRSQTT